MVSCGRRGTRHVHLVSCGQRGARDASCVVLCGQPWYLRFMWFREASVVLEMFHAVSCGQCGTRDVSRGFVWPAWYSRLFMWFRGASVASVVLEIGHVISWGQLGTRGVRCARCQGGTRIACFRPCELASPERSPDVVDTSISRNYHSVELEDEWPENIICQQFCTMYRVKYIKS